MYPYFPQQGRFQGFPAEDRVKHAKANFASYQKDPRTTLCATQKEKSFALTRPYLHRAPTGDSLLILISREHMKDGKARPARNDKMGGLEIAQPRQLTEPQYVGDYAYATKRSLGFQFTQKIQLTCSRWCIALFVWTGSRPKFPGRRPASKALPRNGVQRPVFMISPFQRPVHRRDCGLFKCTSEKRALPAKASLGHSISPPEAPTLTPRATPA